MASSSSTHTLPLPHGHSRHRPHMKRHSHTWHGEVTYRSHFEDFMREIGVDAQMTHLCCVPQQAQRSRTKSEPFPVIAASQQDSTRARTDSIISDSEPVPKGKGVRRQSAPPVMVSTIPWTQTLHEEEPLIPTTTKEHRPERRMSLKSLPTTSISMQSSSTTKLSPMLSVSSRLRAAIRVPCCDAIPSVSSPSADIIDQDQWCALPRPPALERPTLPSLVTANTTPTHSLSRVPSFASFDTLASSEGPKTPEAHSLFHSPTASEETLSPTLKYLEHKSRIRVPSTCVTCSRTGSNFPSCPMCKDTWCSRECRVVANRGKKHACHKRGLEASGIQVATLIG